MLQLITGGSMTKIDTVEFPIISCSKCPNMEAERYYTADSFEHCYEWKCKANDKKTIAYQDTFDKPPKIPVWCPLRK